MARHTRPLSFREPRVGPPAVLTGFVAAVLVAALMVLGFRGGYIPTSWLSAFSPDSQAPAPSVITPESASLAAAPTETPENQALAAPTEEPTEATNAPAAPSRTVAAVATPPATPVVIPPDEVAEQWTTAWNTGDYDGMYSLLGSRAQRMNPRDDFVERYRAIAERAGLSSVIAEVTGSANLEGDVPLQVRFASSIVGDFEEDNLLPMIREEGAWRVDWNPSALFSGLGNDGCVDVDTTPARRGSILDSDGRPLAYDGTVERVGIVPARMTPAEEPLVLAELAKLTGMTTAEIKERYADTDPTWLTTIMDFPVEREAELLNVISQLPGASVQTVPARVYPLGDAAAHITGYVSEVTAEQIAADATLSPGQIVGQAGIEAGADDVLTGQDGVRLLVVDCESRAEQSVIAEVPATEPGDVTLTIDRDLQLATVDALKRQGDVNGSAVVLDPRDGAVRALASIPSFDPNGFIIGFDTKERQALGSETRRPLLDRAAEAAYPTGSIFKVIPFTAAMEDLDYTPDTVLDCPSIFQLPGASQKWEDWTVAEGLGPQGPLTLHQALVNSCNTVFYAIGRDLDDLDSEALPAMTRGFGLGAPTGIQFFPEVGGVVPDPAWKQETLNDGWATGDAVNLAIGQGFLEATPLQMAVAYAAIANGGDVLQPYIVSTITEPDGDQISAGGRITKGRIPASRETIAALQAALRDQTSDWNGAGSVNVFGDFGWPIAGKTGTAQNQLTRDKKPHSWFAGFGPYGEEATIASAVMIENVGEGVSFAAPVTRAIYEAYLANPPDN